jgi:DNA polymerase
MATIHEDIINYLRQQREMYGDRLYVEGATFQVPGATFQVPGATFQVPSTVPSSQIPAPSTMWADTTSLESLNAAICTCMNCPLGATRTNFVFGSGNPNAQLMVIGEAPGADEDEQGLPFVGRAGQLLTKILESIELPRDEVYICNILKCRPPNNRKPLQSETDQCEPYLWKQIELVKPRYILALGLTAANTLLKNKSSMKDLRGSIHDYHGIPTIVTYHPAALLRNPAWKKDTWEDVKYLKARLTE